MLRSSVREAQSVTLTMTTDREALFEAFLNQHDARAWKAVLADLRPSIHEVDRDATAIWFHFGKYLKGQQP